MACQGVKIEDRLAYQIEERTSRALRTDARRRSAPTYETNAWMPMVPSLLRGDPGIDRAALRLRQNSGLRNRFFMPDADTTGHRKLAQATSIPIAHRRKRIHLAMASAIDQGMTCAVSSTPRAKVLGRITSLMKVVAWHRPHMDYRAAWPRRTFTSNGRAISNGLILEFTATPSIEWGRGYHNT